MKTRKAARAIASVLLCGLGAWLALPNPYREKTYLIDAGGCQLETTVLEKQEGGSQGSVVLLHGISANKKIMSYLARGFAEQNLRVYVPDFPGHGRSPGPFSPARAETCSVALLRKLFASGMASPERTIVAGHSMGGAIALRVGARVPVAGVIAISPAPMRSTHGVWPEMLLFPDPGPMPQNFLIISGTLEPESMRESAKDLVSSRSGDTAEYVEIPGATHVSLLFSPKVVRRSQDWASRRLQLTGTPGMPSLRPFCGALAGFLGLLLFASPFLREATEGKRSNAQPETGRSVAWGRMLIEFAAGALLVVILLRFWNPLRGLHLFQGDYLASFLLLLGIALLLLHWSFLREQFSRKATGLLVALFSGMVLLLVFTVWLELSLYEAWLTVAKWARFPLLVVVVLPYHFAEETFLGPVTGRRRGWRRLASGLLLRLVAWSALLLGIFYLHSGEILLVLLAPYFLLLHVLQRRGMDIVHQETGSAAAAAVFGAILLAGFCLVIFPVT
jgi:pimeloyl-ACP methyl ester carboxylesterase